MVLDMHGQPPAFLNRQRRQGRTTEELLGFLRGIMADDHLSDSEIVSLGRMLCDRCEDVDEWLFCNLANRLGRALEDGRIDEAERRELQDAAREVLGGGDDDIVYRHSSDVPLTRPEPSIVFPGQVFVLTGRFVYGSRSECEAVIADLGGICTPSVTRKTNYLVIGSLGSMDWLHTTHGTKIRKAVEYAQKCPIAIVSERHWETAIA